MNVKEYLQRKYKVDTPTTMTKVEAKAFGIPYPLRYNWLKEFGDRTVWPKTLKLLAIDLKKRLKKQERKNKVRGAAHTKNAIAIMTQALAPITPLLVDPNAKAFLESYEWREVRMKVLKRDGARCQCCGATPADGLRMHVDHIKPRRTHPELALSMSNLQVLCEVCNHGKGNWDQTDWRETATVPEEQSLHLRSILNESDPERRH